MSARFNAPIRYNNTGQSPAATRAIRPQSSQQQRQQYQTDPNADFSVYDRAINMSEPRFADEEASQYVEKRVFRRAEVPMLRKVKVSQHAPVVTTTTAKANVPTKRIVQTGSGFQEVTSYQQVDVPSEQVEYKRGYRVDEIEDRQLVEIEEVQRYELKYVPVGKPQLLSTRVLGRIPGGEVSARVKGEEVFHPNHPVLQDLDEDSRPSSPYGSGPQAGSRGIASAQSGSNTQRPSFYRTKPVATRALGGYNDPSVLGNPGVQPGSHAAATNSYDRSGFVNPSLIKPAGSFFKNASYTEQPRQPGGFAPNSEIQTTQWTDMHSVGITVKNTGSAHTHGYGVSVIQTLRGMPGAKAGIQVGDIIRSVNRVNVNTVMEFQQMLQQFPGNLLFTLNRDGRRNVTLTVQR